jgi:hypothetical protein
MVWAPYVLGNNFEEATKKNEPSEADEGSRGFSAEEISRKLGYPTIGGYEHSVPVHMLESSARKTGKDHFEPVASLPCDRPTSDAIEYRVDDSIRGAPVPQQLLYSTIANLPPGRGVQDPLETESDNMVTHLTSNTRVRRWQDPYLSKAAAFGKSPYDIPPGDPGEMIPVTDFLESFESTPNADLRRFPDAALITRLTGRSAPNRLAPRSRDVIRNARAEGGGLSDEMGDSDLTSARFNRSVIQTRRARGRR